MLDFLNSLSTFMQGYVLATVLFPVEYYLLKPVVTRVYNDAIYYVNPVLNKITGKTLPNG